MVTVKIFSALWSAELPENDRSIPVDAGTCFSPWWPQPTAKRKNRTDGIHHFFDFSNIISLKNPVQEFSFGQIFPLRLKEDQKKPQGMIADLCSVFPGPFDSAGYVPSGLGVPTPFPEPPYYPSGRFRSHWSKIFFHEPSPSKWPNPFVETQPPSELGGPP
jgi:hypothetical protein